MQHVESHEDVRAAYLAHRRELIQFANALVGPDEAEDAVSDAMESLLRSGAVTTADNHRALMYRAVLNRGRSRQRSLLSRRARERRFAQTLLSLPPDVQPEVIEAVIRLSVQQRACIFLTYWEDLSPEQIAQRLGVSNGTVKKYLARARARLREVLDE
jgi:RNA polymerase sigma-70 factor (ECF subfamily)